jgi:hypothetical protein
MDYGPGPKHAYPIGAFLLILAAKRQTWQIRLLVALEQTPTIHISICQVKHRSTFVILLLQIERQRVHWRGHDGGKA